MANPSNTKFKHQKYVNGAWVDQETGGGAIVQQPAGTLDHAGLNNLAWDISGHTKGAAEKTSLIGSDLIAIFDSENNFMPSVVSFDTLLAAIGSAPPPTLEAFYILSEAGDILSTESGDHLVIESSSAPPPSETFYLLSEAGDILSTESGDHLRT